MVPPLVQHALADELEPGREFEGRIFEHSFQIVLADKARVAHLVGVDVQIDISLDEENVVD